MSEFFTTPVKALTLTEVQQLFDGRVQENIRLEYKREVPASDADFKDEMAKALSSFANTYGGYFVVGVATDAAGIPTAMNGVPEVAGYAQKVSSIGYQEVYPPLIPDVSNPIRLPSGNVIYVAYQDLSLAAPHFMTKRRGAYVRTSEFSQTFSPQLATWNDLQFLANRRTEAITLRENLLERGRDRAGRLVPEEIWRRNPTTLMLGVTPAYPARPLIELEDLQATIDGSRVGARQTSFPYGEPLSLKDRLGLVSPPLYVESSIYGSSFCVDPFTDPEDLTFIPGMWTLSRILLWLRYGAQFLLRSGYDGQVFMRATLSRIGRKQFLWSRAPEYGMETYPCSEDEVSIDAEASLGKVVEDVGQMALRLFRPLAFGAGWRRAYEAPEGSLLAQALQALMRDDRFLRVRLE